TWQQTKESSTNFWRGVTMKGKKLIVLTMATSMVLAACSSGDSNDSNEGSGATSTPAPAQSPLAQDNKKHAISGITYVFGNPSPLNGAGQKALNEKFNVDYKLEKIPQEDYVEKLTAIVAGGNVPDMIGFRPTNLTLFQQ